MYDDLNNKEVSSGKKFSRVARGLGRAFGATIAMGGGGAAFASTNEAAMGYAVVGFAIDVFRLVRDKGEQIMSDFGMESGAQKAANRKMEEEIKRMEARQAQKNDDSMDARMKF